MKTEILACTLLLVFNSCNPTKSLTADDSLTALNATARAKAPNCASCHDYPLHDVQHQYHLMASNPNAGMLHDQRPLTNNGRITCMDCHFESIAHTAAIMPETTYAERDDSTIVVYGWVRAQNELVDPVLFSINPITRYHATPWTASTTPITHDSIDQMMEDSLDVGVVLSWVTSGKHLNGQLDVEFPPNNLTNEKVAITGYNPVELSCSAIACHNSATEKYRWASPARHLKGCPTVDGNDSLCEELIAPTP